MEQISYSRLARLVRPYGLYLSYKSTPTNNVFSLISNDSSLLFAVAFPVEELGGVLNLLDSLQDLPYVLNQVSSAPYRKLVSYLLERGV